MSNNYGRKPSAHADRRRYGRRTPRRRAAGVLAYHLLLVTAGLSAGTALGPLLTLLTVVDCAAIIWITARHAAGDPEARR